MNEWKDPQQHYKVQIERNSVANKLAGKLLLLIFFPQRWYRNFELFKAAFDDISLNYLAITNNFMLIGKNDYSADNLNFVCTQHISNAHHRLNVDHKKPICSCVVA